MIQALTIQELKLRLSQPVFIVESQNRDIKPCWNRVSWVSLDEIGFENGFITMLSLFEDGITRVYDRELTEEELVEVYREADLRISELYRNNLKEV